MKATVTPFAPASPHFTQTFGVTGVLGSGVTQPLRTAIVRFSCAKPFYGVISRENGATSGFNCKSSGEFALALFHGKLCPYHARSSLV